MTPNISHERLDKINGVGARGVKGIVAEIKKKQTRKKKHTKGKTRP